MGPANSNTSVAFTSRFFTTFILYVFLPSFLENLMGLKFHGAISWITTSPQNSILAHLLSIHESTNKSALTQKTSVMALTCSLQEFTRRHSLRTHPTQGGHLVSHIERIHNKANNAGVFSSYFVIVHPPL